MTRTYTFSILRAYAVCALAGLVATAVHAARLQMDADDTLGLVHLSPIMNSALQLHVARNELTPEMAAATMSNYIEFLDYSKVFLLQADVDEAYACRLRFPQALETHGWGFVTGIFDRFLARVDAQTSHAVARLSAQPFNLDTNRAIVVDPKKIGFPATDADARARIDDMLQYQVAYLVSIGEPLTGAVAKVERRRLRFSRQFHDLKPRERLSVFINSFCNALDPHTAYMSYDDLDEFNINISLALEGIGAVLQSEEGVTVISALTPGGPADKSGAVKAGDKIMAVAQGTDGDFVDIYDMELRDVVKKIRGKKGTIVRLQLVRKTDKGTERKTAMITRDKVKLEDQAARMELVHAVRTNAAGAARMYTVAAIDLPSFYADPGAKPLIGKSTRSAVSDVRRLLQTCQTSGVDAVVLDMQRNGGGLLDEAVDVAGLFFRKGNVVVARDRLNSSKALADTDSSVEFAGPLAVTVSRVTASGAEIVAGALQDYHRALIVGGDHTYGKGTIQQVMPLNGKLGALKVTVGEYFLASGRSPQHSGVIPDIVIPSELSALQIGERYQDSALPANRVENSLSTDDRIGQNWSRVTCTAVTQLCAQSLIRVSSSAEFKKIGDNVRKIKEDQEKDRVVIASLLQNVSTNKSANGANGTVGNANGATPAEDAVPSSLSSRQPITNDVVVMEAVQIMADWLAERGQGGVPVPTNAPVAAVSQAGLTNTMSQPVVHAVEENPVPSVPRPAK